MNMKKKVIASTKEEEPNIKITMRKFELGETWEFSTSASDDVSDVGRLAWKRVARRDFKEDDREAGPQRSQLDFDGDKGMKGARMQIFEDTEKMREHSLEVPGIAGTNSWLYERVKGMRSERESIEVLDDAEDKDAHRWDFVASHTEGGTYHGVFIYDDVKTESMRNRISELENIGINKRLLLDQDNEEADRLDSGDAKAMVVKPVLKRAKAMHSEREPLEDRDDTDDVRIALRVFDGAKERSRKMVSFEADDEEMAGLRKLPYVVIEVGKHRQNFDEDAEQVLGPAPEDADAYAGMLMLDSDSDGNPREIGLNFAKPTVWFMLDYDGAEQLRGLSLGNREKYAGNLMLDRDDTDDMRIALKGFDGVKEKSRKMVSFEADDEERVVSRRKGLEEDSEKVFELGLDSDSTGFERARAEKALKDAENEGGWFNLIGLEDAKDMQVVFWGYADKDALRGLDAARKGSRKMVSFEADDEEIAALKWEYEDADNIVRDRKILDDAIEKTRGLLTELDGTKKVRRLDSEDTKEPICHGEYLEAAGNEGVRWFLRNPENAKAMNLIGLDSVDKVALLRRSLVEFGEAEPERDLGDANLYSVTRGFLFNEPGSFSASMLLSVRAEDADGLDFDGDGMYD